MLFNDTWVIIMFFSLLVLIPLLFFHSLKEGFQTPQVPRACPKSVVLFLTVSMRPHGSLGTRHIIFLFLTCPLTRETNEENGPLDRKYIILLIVTGPLLLRLVTKSTLQLNANVACYRLYACALLKFIC